MSNPEKHKDFELQERTEGPASKPVESNEKAILIDKEHKVSTNTAIRLRYAAIVISWLSVIISLILGTLAIVFAALNESQSLFSFGLDSMLDCVSSLIILWRFHGKDIYSKIKELRACIMIGALFLLSGVLLAVRCILALVSLDRLHKPNFALILSSVNGFCCFILGSSKVYLGHKLESRALITDSIITFVGAVMSLFALLFSVVYEHTQRFWYLDDSFGIVCSIFLFCYGIRVIVLSRLELKIQNESTSS